MTLTRDAPSDVNQLRQPMPVLTPSGRRIMTAGSVGRLGYGLAAMFAPRFIAGRWAPAESESVMSLRGFGGQYIAVAVFTLLAARSPHLTRPALLLNVGVDVCDAMAGGFEVREKGAGDAIAMGGIGLPAINLATWLWALHELEPQ